MKRILCYGDSLTFGEIPNITDTIRYEKRWTKVLSEKLGENFCVIEEGLSSRTTNLEDDAREGRNGLTYFTPCVLSHVPLDYVVVMLGTNDLKEKYNRTPEAIAETFLLYKQKTAEAAKYWGIAEPQMVLIAPPVVKESFIPAAWGFKGAERKGRKLPEIYRNISDTIGAIFIDANSIVETSVRDGAHWDEDMNLKFGEELAKLFLDRN